MKGRGDAVPALLPLTRRRTIQLPKTQSLSMLDIVSAHLVLCPRLALPCSAASAVHLVSFSSSSSKAGAQSNSFRTCSSGSMRPFLPGFSSPSLS